MVSLDIRFRTGWLVVAVVVGHIVLISAQVNTAGGVPLLEAATVGVFGEVQRGVASVTGGVREGWQNYFAIQQIREENERLRRELAQAQVALQQEQALAQQARGLEELLALRTEVPLETAAATVIATGASPEFRYVTIDKGTHDGVQLDMAVIAPEGVVGRVVTAGRRVSKVQLLVDRNAAAGAIVERSRAQGLAVGTGGDLLSFEFFPETADLEVGDRVVTSGIEGIYPSSLGDGRFPRGFVIGRIESIERAPGRPSRVVIAPAVDVTRLEAVLVVLNRPAGATGEP